MRSISILAALVLSVVLLTAHASAAVLFSNLDANNTSTASATILGGSSNFFNATLAGDFTVPAGGLGLTALTMMGTAVSTMMGTTTGACAEARGTAAAASANKPMPATLPANFIRYHP